MSIDLRCPHRKFGVLVEPSTSDGLVEVTCPSRWCGRREGVVVLHTFNTRTGELVRTRQYKQPTVGGGKRGSKHDPASVRSA